MIVIIIIVIAIIINISIMSQKNLQDLINKFDEDGNGVIEFTEFLCMMASKMQEDEVSNIVIVVIVILIVIVIIIFIISLYGKRWPPKGRIMSTSSSQPSKKEL